MTGDDKLETCSRPDLIDEVRALRRRVEELETHTGAGPENRLRLLRLVADNVPASIAYIDEHERYLIVNKQYEEVHRLPADAIEGMTLKELVGDASYREREKYLRRAQAGESVTFDLERDYPQFGRRIIEITYVPDIDADGHLRGLFGMGQDVTDARQVEQALRKSERQHRSILDNAMVGMTLTDSAGRFVQTNAAYQRFVGRSEAELRHMTWRDFAYPGELVEIAQLNDEVRNGTRSRVSFEKHYRRPDGTVMWAYVELVPVPGDEPDETFFAAIVQDITEHKAALDSLRDSELRLANAQKLAHIGSSQRNVTTGEAVWSNEIYSILGQDPATYDPSIEKFGNIVHPDDRARFDEYYLGLAEDELTYDFNMRIVRSNGDVRDVHILSEPGYDERGVYVSRLGTVQDVTDRMTVERALKDSEQNLRGIMDNVADGVATISEQGFIRSINPSAEAMFGYPASEMVGKKIEMLMPESGSSSQEPYIQRYLDTGVGRLLGKGPSDVEGQRKDGSVFPMSLAVSEMQINGERIFIGSMRDVTERMQVQEALQESEGRFRAIFEGAAIGISVSTIDGQLAQFNPAFAKMLGYQAAQIDGRFWADITHPDDIAENAVLAEQLDRGEISSFQLEKRFLRKDGETMWGRLTVSLVRDDAGQAQFRVAMIEDITVRKQAESDLKESEARLARAQEIARLGYWWWDIETDQTYFSAEQSRQFGVHPAAPSPGYNEFLGLVHPDDRDAVAEAMQKAIALQAPYDTEYRLVRPDGETRYFYSVGEVELNSAGKPIRLSGITQDITERRQVEEQLRQAQKMEAVGQLTGGIAHDFNNLLAVMLGNLELIQDRTGADEQINELIERALQAVERCASLTSRLLAFSRKQTLQPTAVEAGGLIAGMAGMLHRTLGETIEIRTAIADDLWPCDADPAQLESAVLNLALNARAAMPDGGRLDVAAANVSLDESNLLEETGTSPGDYVVLSVSDSGTGISPEVLHHVFEPFFTTKGVGEGSGLGLSMVYGFASQSGGHATIQSVPGEGTTVRIYLPRSTGPEVELADAQAGSAEGVSPTSRGERVLLVEDDDDVRALVADLLSDLGYAFVQAANGAAALDVLAQSQPIDLLLTDVVLPGGMTGVELATEVRRRQPSIMVQLMSGYARAPGDAASHYELTGRLLNKPFSKSDFAQAIRGALDSQGEGVAP